MLSWCTPWSTEPSPGSCYPSVIKSWQFWVCYSFWLNFIFATLTISCLLMYLWMFLEPSQRLTSTTTLQLMDLYRKESPIKQPNPPFHFKSDSSFWINSTYSLTNYSNCKLFQHQINSMNGFNSLAGPFSQSSTEFEHFSSWSVE
jgi:hypothetical protein